MSERILKALMQLFAIIARVDENLDNQEQVTSGEGRKIVRAFLGQELNSAAVQEYLSIFDDLEEDVSIELEPLDGWIVIGDFEILTPERV